jgi:hypothetical protein
MYLVVRSYEQTHPRYKEEGFRRVRDELVPLISAIEGFVSYYSAYDSSWGRVTSVSLYETREAAERSNEIAVQWGERNLAIMGTINPSSWVGDILVGVESLPQA